MTVTERVAYLKGLAEGMKIDENTNEGKLLLNIIDVMEDLALELSDVGDSVEEIYEQLDELDEDLGELEEEFYGECDCGDVDGAIYEVECPTCGNLICLDEDMVESGMILCPGCGEKLEFDLDDDCDCDKESDE